MARRVVRILVYLAYLAVVVAVGVEGIGRLMFVSDGAHLYRKRYALFAFDPELNYVLTPGFSIAGSENRLYPGVELRISSSGLRSKELDDRPAIYVAGDSVVFGYGVSAADTMASRLEAKLGERVQVINGGVPGYNFEQTQRFADRLTALRTPLALVVLINANDLQPRYYITQGGGTISRFRAYPWESNLPQEHVVARNEYGRWILPAAMRQLAAFDPPRSQPKTNADTAAMLESTRRILTYEQSNDPAFVSRKQQAFDATRAFAERYAARHIPVVFAFFPFRVAVMGDAQDDVLTEWSQAIRPGSFTSVVDLTAALSAAETREPQFLVADEHPNAAGHETIAAAIAEALRAMGIPKQ